METTYQPHSINFRRFQSYNRHILTNNDIIIFELIVILVNSIGQNEIYHTTKQFCQDTSIPKRSVENAVKKLVKLKLINKEARGIPKKNYYSINFNHLAVLLSNIYRLKNDDFEAIYSYYDDIYSKVNGREKSPFLIEFEKIQHHKEFNEYSEQLLNIIVWMGFGVEEEYHRWATFKLYYFIKDTKHDDDTISKFYHWYGAAQALFEEYQKCHFEYSFTIDVQGNYTNFNNYLSGKFAFEEFERRDKKLMMKEDRKGKFSRIIDESLNKNEDFNPHERESEFHPTVQIYDKDLKRNWDSLE